MYDEIRIDGQCQIDGFTEWRSLPVNVHTHEFIALSGIRGLDATWSFGTSDLNVCSTVTGIGTEERQRHWIGGLVAFRKLITALNNRHPCLICVPELEILSELQWHIPCCDPCRSVGDQRVRSFHKLASTGPEEPKQALFDNRHGNDTPGRQAYLNRLEALTRRVQQGLDLMQSGIKKVLDFVREVLLRDLYLQIRCHIFSNKKALHQYCRGLAARKRYFCLFTTGKQLRFLTTYHLAPLCPGISLHMPGYSQVHEPFIETIATDSTISDVLHLDQYVANTLT